nr:sigma 54-interacting transcriptional regulator [Pseudomonas brassicae]
MPILITGETGTGKEAFARAIHQASARHAAPFVALNCAAIPESLIESELFGYRGGSFTGADKKGMKGKLELAAGGTLFLDEIGDMPAHLQTRLLRVLAEREIFPIGAQAPVALDVQVISATHQDLHGMIDQKRFRQDLYYRLGGMNLALPALRDRSDRAELIERLLAAQGAGLRLTEQARECLYAQAWPGNIRQLLNTLRYAAALAEDGWIDVDCLPMELLQVSRSEPLRIDRQDPASELLEVLRRHRWNISAVAGELGGSALDLVSADEEVWGGAAQ